VPHRNLARAQVYDLLRDAIVSLELTPGERILDSAWAMQLGVSRTPVREAVLQLADEGLVDVVPQRGTFVARISATAVREADFVREALETAALRAAAERLDATSRDRFRANLDAQRAAEAADDRDRFYELDEAFHRLILDASGHPDLWQVAHRSRVQLDRARRLGLRHSEPMSTLISHHERIATGLLAGDVNGAEEALREHLELVQVNLPGLAEEYPDYFLDVA
jgi:GntR family transcriptional regulator, rspAB operon transcriptional repressor